MPMPAVAPRVAKALSNRQPPKTAHRSAQAPKPASRVPTGKTRRLASDALFDRLPIH
jgi:hypothetical protein